MKKWRKCGQIFRVEPIEPFLRSHASNPLPVHLKGDEYRVFYSGRDLHNRSSVGWVDLDIEKMAVIEICKEPIFTFSSDETDFYSHGVSVGNCYEINGMNYMLFMGWQIRDNAHWRGDIGRLILDSDLKKLSLDPQEPFMGADQEDAVSLSYPFVMSEEGIYKMWYGSTVSWDSPNEEMIHIIKYAESVDGINWSKKGVAVPWALGIAQAFSRPSVLKDSGQFHMWFSFREGGGDMYKIGYSCSEDGVRWTNHLQDGLPASERGWDSEMVCYPFVFKHKGQTYMLYNGNDYGKDGFGLAILEGD